MSSDFFEEDFFDEGDESFTGPEVTDALVAAAESALGLKLPPSYIRLLRLRNGGYIRRRRCYATPYETSWSPDHIAVDVILGIGGSAGIDNAKAGSQVLVEEWGYPNVGCVICDTPSAGHDTVMLDYSSCGTQGAPRVVYVDEDRVPRPLAPTFENFISGLVVCPEGE